MAETMGSHVDDNTYNGVVLYHQLVFTTEQNPNSSEIVIPRGPPCRQILYAKIRNSSISVWDLMILVPNVLFFLFLVIKFRRICIKVGRNESPIFSVCVILLSILSRSISQSVATASGSEVLRTTADTLLQHGTYVMKQQLELGYFTLPDDLLAAAMDLAYPSLAKQVCLANVISLVRCIVSMCISVPYSTSDRVIWLLLRFFLLATELSVILFGFIFGHLDSRRSLQRVLFVTFTVALAYSFTQGALEFLSPNETFHNITIKPGSSYYLFGHGGMMFWFISSVLLSVVYVTVCILPLTAFSRRFAVPTRMSFYVYCAILAVLNIAQSVGCGLLYFMNEPSGWCIIDATAYLYFAGFAPLIYLTFLRNFFVFTQRPKLSISYQIHADEPVGGEEPDLPYSIHHPALLGSQPPMSINAQEDEVAVDDEDATGMAFGTARSQQPLLHGWRHLHDVFVGIPEVKNVPPSRRSVGGNATPSPPSRHEERR